MQPQDRGTAAGILLPAQWIAWRDPEATVADLPVGPLRRRTTPPSCGTSRPSRRSWSGTRAASSSWRPRPTRWRPGYGWIEPGVELERTVAGKIRAVDRFVEKPSPEAARACLARGGLWNTFVMVAKVSAILEAGRRALPDLMERLYQIRPSAESEGEARAIAQAYAEAPTADFSRSVLTPSVEPARRFAASAGQLERLGHARARPRDAAARRHRAELAATARVDGLNLASFPDR